MDVIEKYLSFGSSTLYYVKAGAGNKNLLLFHGFGQDHTVFKPFIEPLASRYTLYIFDLFFHGKSHWKNGEYPLEKEQWKEIISIFLKDNQLNKFSIAGYSLGGKFALATLECYPESIDKLFLIAADGIKTSFWYSVVTYPYLVRRLFKRVILHPKLFFAITKIAHALKLADPSLLRFVEHQMNSEDKRRKVYFSWVVFRHLQFDMKKIARIINEQPVRTIFILGMFDKVIKQKNMNRLTNHLTNYDMEVLHTGHNGVLDIKNILQFFKE